MAGTTPPPDAPGHPAPAGGSSGDPGAWFAGAEAARVESLPPYQGGQHTRRGLTALAVAVVLALMLAGGAFAFYKTDPFHLFRPGPQAAEGLPGNAVLYAGIDLDPTASQKVEALRFLNHFPAFRDSAGIRDENADVRAVIFGKLIDSMHCSGVDYEHDVKPWLGQRFGVALMPPSPEEPQPVVVAIQVSDEDAARTGIEAVNGCGGAASAVSTSDSTPGIAFANDYMLLAKTQTEADAYAASASQLSLADDPEFKADMDSLGDPGVATVWVDVAAAVPVFLGDSAQIDNLKTLTSTTQRVAATFRFASDSVEIATSIYGDTPAIEHDDNPIVSLPDSTVFALSESGASERVAQSWDDVLARGREQNPGLDEQISDFEAQSGFVLPDDLETLFGNNILLALDAEGLTSDALQGDDPSLINFGARLTNDPAKLNALYDKLLELLGSAVDGQVPFVKHEFADGIAIATNQGYADKLGALGGTLGDTDAFRSVVDDAANKEFVLFFSFDAVKDQVLQAMSDGGAPQEAIDNLRPLRAFGVSQEVDGDYTHGTIRLSVDD